MAGTHIHYSRDVKHMPRAFKLCRRWLLFLVHLCSCVTRGKGVEAEAGAVSSSFELPLRAETARTVRVVGSAYGAERAHGACV